MEIIKSIALSGDDYKDKTKILLHSFSNGGMKTNISLRTLLPELPPHVAILDSCPGYYSYKSTHKAMLASSPPNLRAIGWPLVHLIIIFATIVGKISRIPPWPTENARLMNLTDAGQTQIERRRMYFYGTADDMVSWKDVERHANEAKRNGFDVRLEKFEGAKHVACTRVDGVRYWKAVEEFWGM